MVVSVCVQLEMGKIDIFCNGAVMFHNDPQFSAMFHNALQHPVTLLQHSVMSHNAPYVP